jgi:hypothetical protein
LTKIKAVSVLAVAFVLTALGATSAFAWAPITPSADCHKVTVTADDSSHWYTKNPDGVLVFKQADHDNVSVPFHFDSKHPDNPIVNLTVDGTKKDHIGPGEWTVEVLGDHSTMKSFTVPTCETPTPTPSETPKPSASATATPSATTEPSASATATPSATSSEQPTSTSVPSPPVTGQGSSGGDGNFGIVLLVMVLGTVVIGGTTLALSHKGS